MRLLPWEDLPEYMKNESVRKYYEILQKKRAALIAKRIFDLVGAMIMLAILAPLFVVVSIAIKLDSRGPVLFRQIRVTQYGKRFEILKFRTMVAGADKMGSQITTRNDSRITRVGRFLRKSRIDEFPQLLNIISGDMSFVGPRPEVEKIVEQYKDEMMATLLLPAGVTSEASILFKNEERMLLNEDDVDQVYMEIILPMKMKHNLRNIANFSMIYEIWIVLRTVACVFGGSNFFGDEE